MYVVLVQPGDRPFSYILNGVLVGDDPLDLTDWTFIDPVSGQRVRPGDAALPIGSDIRITVPTELFTGGFNSGPDLLRFALSSRGTSLLRADAELVRVRQPLPPHRIDNRTDLLRPRIVPVSPPLLVFERMIDAIPSAVDVHLSDFPPAGLRPGVPLTRSPERTRLLDVSRGPDGTIHLLFTGERRFIPGVFYARLDPTQRRIDQFQRIAQGIRMARRGRVVATADGDVHAFWLEVENNIAQPHESGIYWSRRGSSGPWGPAVRLAPEGAARDAWYINELETGGLAGAGRRRRRKTDRRDAAGWLGGHRLVSPEAVQHEHRVSAGGRAALTERQAASERESRSYRRTASRSSTAIDQPSRAGSASARSPRRKMSGWSGRSAR